MDFGSKVVQLRKAKGLSQTGLAAQLSIHKNVLGRYERGEATPSVDVARKIADLLDVSLDYLTGKVDEHIDRSIVDKVISIQKLPKEERDRIIFTLDALIRDARSRFAYA